MRSLSFRPEQARRGKIWWRTIRGLWNSSFLTYRCCAFKNNICGDRLGILEGMPNSSNPLPPEFFDNPRCSPGPRSRRGHRCKSRSRLGGWRREGGCRRKAIELCFLCKLQLSWKTLQVAPPWTHMNLFVFF